MNEDNKKLFKTPLLSLQKLLGLFKGNAGSFINSIFKIMFSVFFISASFFLLVHTFNNYLILNIPKVLISSSMDIVSNETLLSVITLLIALAGFLAYIFRTIIRLEMKSELYKMAREERIASQVQTLTTASYILGELSDIASDTASDCIMCKNVQTLNKEAGVPLKISLCKLHNRLLKTSNMLDTAINFDKKNYIKIQELGKEIYGYVIFQAKNNYAWNLAEKQKRGEKLDHNDKLIAINFSNEMKKLIYSSEIYKYEGVTEKVVKNWDETCMNVDEIFKEEIEKLKNT